MSLIFTGVKMQDTSISKDGTFISGNIGCLYERIFNCCNVLLSSKVKVRDRIAAVEQKCMNWNGGSLMSGAMSRCLEQSIFDEAIDEEDFKRVSMLKEDISSTACELTMLICRHLLHSMWLAWLTSLITKSCQQRWLLHSCSFYKVVC